MERSVGWNAYDFWMTAGFCAEDQEWEVCGMDILNAHRACDEALR